MVQKYTNTIVLRAHCVWNLTVYFSFQQEEKREMELGSQRRKEEKEQCQLGYVYFISLFYCCYFRFFSGAHWMHDLNGTRSCWCGIWEIRNGSYSIWTNAADERNKSYFEIKLSNLDSQFVIWTGNKVRFGCIIVMLVWIISAVTWWNKSFLIKLTNWHYRKRMNRFSQPADMSASTLSICEMPCIDPIRDAQLA